MKVFVVDVNEKPLMPCSPRTARLLLRSGAAVKFMFNPFTIKMTRETGHYVQKITLGVDPGYQHVGLSATTEKEELYASELELRTDIQEKLATRLEWRRTRRNRLEYRKPRFSNRRKPDNWLAPSVRSRLDAHFNEIKRITKILPVSEISLEVAAFDIQKIKNPDIQGAEYQQGTQFGFWNIREYVLWRDGYKCRHCMSKSKDPILNVHHIESRKTGGDSPVNLVTLCGTCHKAYHAGKIKLNFKKGKSFKSETFMGVMRKFLSLKLHVLSIPIIWTYGYITKHARIANNIAKTHCADAFCIAGNLKAKRLGEYLLRKQVRKRGRQANKANLANGGKWLAKRTDWEIEGFRRFDKVLYDRREVFVWGLRKRGYFLLKTLSGEKAGEVSFKKLRLIERASNWLSEMRYEAANSSPA